MKKKKKNRLVCNGLSFQALWPYKGLSDSLATPFSQLTVLCPAQQVCGAQAGAELGAKVISFSQVILFSPSSLRSLRNRRRLSNHTLPHLWGWEGSYFCWKRKNTTLGLFIWKEDINNSMYFSHHWEGATEKPYFGLLLLWLCPVKNQLPSLKITHRTLGDI